MTENTFTETTYNRLTNLDRNWNSFKRTSSGHIARRVTLDGTDVNVDNTSVSTDGIIGKASGTNADFTTAYASATTLTCSSLPSGVSAIKSDDIITIQQISTSGEVTNTYSRDDVTITASGTDPTTLTVAEATFVATDTFIVYTNIPQARGDKVDLIEIAGTATNVNGGNRDAGTQTITLADDDPAVTALEIIDDWDESDRAKVNLVVGQAGISAGSAAITTNTPSVTLATDDPAVTALEKIDDLQGALKSVDTDELITRVTDSSGTEINPAKEDGNLSTIKDALTREYDNVGAVSSSLTTGNNDSTITLASGATVSKISLAGTFVGDVKVQFFDGTAAGGTDITGEMYVNTVLDGIRINKAISGTTLGVRVTGVSGSDVGQNLYVNVESY